MDSKNTIGLQRSLRAKARSENVVVRFQREEKNVPYLKQAQVKLTRKGFPASPPAVVR